MPEAQQQQQQQQDERTQTTPQSYSRSRIIELSILAIVMVVEALIIIIVMSKPKSEAVSTPEATAPVITEVRPVSELLAPTIDVPNVITSVRVDESGSRLKTLIMGITLKIGRVVEGKEEKSVDLKYLEKEYKPKVVSLIPVIKNLLIREATSRTYAELLDPAVQQQILEDVRRKVNETLKEYGVEPRIVGVYWTVFHFN